MAAEDDWLEKLGEYGEAARQLYAVLIEDAGGEDAVTVGMCLAVKGVVSREIILEHTRGYLFGPGGGPINKRSKRLKPIVEQLDRLQVSQTRDLQAIGAYERRQKPVQSLSE